MLSIKKKVNAAKIIMQIIEIEIPAAAEMHTLDMAFDHTLLWSRRIKNLRIKLVLLINMRR